MHWSCILHLGWGHFQGNLKFWQRYAEFEKHPVLPQLSLSPTELGLQLPGKSSLSSTFPHNDGREGNTMLQLWEPNTALNSFHKFTNLGWLVTRGAFWNTEPILVPLAQEVPDPFSAGCGEGSPCACPVPVLICPQLIAVQLLERGQGSLQTAPYGWCCCPGALITLCTSMYAPEQTVPTALFVFLLREKK